MKKTTTKSAILKNLKMKMQKDAQKNKATRKRHLTFYGM